MVVGIIDRISNAIGCWGMYKNAAGVFYVSHSSWPGFWLTESSVDSDTFLKVQARPATGLLVSILGCCQSQHSFLLSQPSQTRWRCIEPQSDKFSKYILWRRLSVECSELFARR